MFLEWEACGLVWSLTQWLGTNTVSLWEQLGGRASFKLFEC